MNWAFKVLKVIIIGVSRNPERIVVIMYNNVDIISEIYEENSIGKTAKLRFNDNSLRNAFEYLEIPVVYIARTYSHCPTFLPLIAWVHSVAFHAIVFESQTI